MKKTLLSIVALLLFSGSMLRAQEVTTYSAYDTNLDDEVTIEDVTGAANRVLRKVESDPQLMKAEDVVEALNRVYDRIDKLSLSLSTLSMLNGIAPSSVNGNDLVDLGLPSGTLWAANDVGSTELGVRGSFIAWAETSPKSLYSNSNYVYPHIIADPSSVPDVIPEGQDAATKNMGSNWQIPTIEQWQELLDANNCTVDINATYNGNDVVTVTSKTNGNVLILCKSGFMSSNSEYSDTYQMAYWSNAGPESDHRRAYAATIRDGEIGTNYNMWKHYGMHVRGVVSKSISDVVLDNRPQSKANLATAVSISESTYAMKTGEVVALTASVSPSDASDKSVSWYSNNQGVASVNSNGVVTANGVGTAVVTVVANGGSGLSASCTITVTKASSSIGDGTAHEYVDLGLPSGNLWATCNVGADSPEQYGKYYAWGETTAYLEVPSAYPSTQGSDWNGSTNSAYTLLVTNKTKKTSYKWDSYKWGAEATSIYKYKTSAYNTLVAADDAAYVNWGESWRMPTKSDIDELLNNCYFQWVGDYKNTEVGGVIIYKVKYSTDKGLLGTSPRTYTTSDTHIFIPAAGHYSDAAPINRNSICEIWSRDINTNANSQAYILKLTNSDLSVLNYYRYYGMPVRPIYIGK